VATHQRLLTFGPDFASRLILRPKYHILDNLFSILTKVWRRKGRSNVFIQYWYCLWDAPPSMSGVHNSSSQVQSSYLFWTVSSSFGKGRENVDSPSVWQVPPHYQRYLLLIKLLNGNLQRICFALEIDQYWRIHAETAISYIRPSKCL
jgi:hypothetical protein